MRKCFILVLAMGVTAIFVPIVTAGSIVQSAHYDFGIESGASSFQEYMGGFFTQFDDLGGTRILERVTLTYGILASAHVTVENDAEYPDWGVMTFTVSLDVIPWPNPVDMPGEYTIDLAATNGVTGSGPDFYDFGILSLDAFDGYWETTSELDWFSSGNPEDEFVFDGRAEFTLGGGMGGLLTVSDFTASMNASLTYEYSVVPEPATLILLGLGAIVLRNKHKN